jgi:hypothetical protein
LQVFTSNGTLVCASQPTLQVGDKEVY